MKKNMQILMLALAFTLMTAVVARAGESKTPIWQSNGADPYGVPGSDQYGDDTIYLGVLEAPAVKPAPSTAESYMVPGTDQYGDPHVYLGVMTASRTEEQEKAESLAAREEDYEVIGADSYDDETIYLGVADKGQKEKDKMEMMPDTGKVQTPATGATAAPTNGAAATPPSSGGAS
jgi:hypothetical protein